MTDFAEFRPRPRPRPCAASESGRAHGPSVVVRSAAPRDALDLAAVMAARGGTVLDHLESARQLIRRLPVLLVAEVSGAVVGWSGAQRAVVHAETPPEWLVAGLTVLPEHRRRGIAAELLDGVVHEVRAAAPAAPVFSIVNAQNRASLALHKAAGFREVERAGILASITFTGGVGVLLRRGHRGC